MVSGVKQKPHTHTHTHTQSLRMGQWEEDQHIIWTHEGSNSRRALREHHHATQDIAGEASLSS